MKNLYQYNKKLLIQIDDCWGEISPLQGFSKETFEEAKEEILQVLHENKQPTLPSVIWGLSVLPITAVRIPLCALNRPRDGCKTLKLKVGHLSVENAVRHVSQYIDQYRLRIDCNRKWTLNQALEFTRHFRSTDFEYLEEPTKELIEFSKLTDFSIALDESLRDNINIPNAKYAVIKPSLTGHIPKLSLPTVLSSSYETSLGILQIARLASQEIAHGLDTFVDDIIDPPIRVEEGYLIWSPSKNPINTSKLCKLATVP
ncbi:MAG TPA: enolase C-terminal domain-like protein [Chlamydiales bacterium]|nr:enolase C-terminal domain-like protein [Chlamydiales bacterium]